MYRKIIKQYLLLFSILVGLSVSSYAYASEEENGDDSVNSTITGQVTIPSDMSLTPLTDECFGENGPLLSCQFISIDIFDLNDGFLGSTRVETDGSYELGFNTSLENGATLDVNMKFHIYRAGGMEEHYYRDFGTDNIANDNDSFKDEYTIEYDEENNTPNVNHLIISSQDTVIDLDLDSLHDGESLLEGSIIMPSDFIFVDNSDNFNRISIQAINISTGEEYRREVVRVETTTGNHTYPFRLYVPNGQDYIIALGKENNSKYFIMYLNDESGVSTAFSDHIFDDDEILISDFGVNGMELSNGKWIPNTTQTGYFTINGDVSDINIDVSSFESTLKKIEGTITPPTGFDLTNEQNRMYIELKDVITGDWLASTHLESDGSFSLALGSSIKTDGYIIRLRQEYDINDANNGSWRSFYFDLGADNSLGGSGEDEDTVKEEYSQSSINPLIITDSITLNIDLTGYTPPEMYTVTGKINAIPDGAENINVFLYNPITDRHISNHEEVDSSGNFEITDIIVGEYILRLSYELEGQYYEYTIVSGSSFSTEATTVDRDDIEELAYDSSGELLAENSSEEPAYFLPKEIDTQKVMLGIESDIEIAEFTVIHLSLQEFTLNLTSVGSNKQVNIELYVPNQPIVRGEELTSNNSGEVSVMFNGIKARDDYQLRIQIEDMGEYFYDKTNNRLSSDVYEIGKQNGTVCDDDRNDIHNCNGDEEIERNLNIEGFSIVEDTAFDLVVPNDKSLVTSTLQLGSDYANEVVYIDIFQHNGDNNMWETFTLDANGMVEFSMPVKNGNGYRVEIYLSSSHDSYVVSQQSELMTAQNSWETNGDWGPKKSTLIDINNDIDLGALTLPSLNTIVFTITNLDAEEEIYIDLEGVANSQRYGKSNINWSDWENSTYSTTVTIKVPNDDYRLMVHPQNHQGGVVHNGNETSNETIESGSTMTNFSWDWNKADKLSVGKNQTYTIALPSSANMRQISGTVNGLGAGWIQALLDNGSGGNGAEGNGAEVNGTEVNEDGTFDGTFTIKGLVSGTYTLEYWSSNTDDFIRIPNVNITSNVTGYSISKSTTVHTLNGTVTNISAGDNKDISVFLLDVSSSDDWVVIDEKKTTLSNAGTHDYSFNASPLLDSHYYAVAVGLRVVNATTGETTFTTYEATTQDTVAVALDNIENDVDSLSISVTESVTESVTDITST